MSESGPITRQTLLDYFLEAAKPRSEWRIGMEVERMARDAASGQALRYGPDTPSIHSILEAYRHRRKCSPILEGSNLIGLIGSFGSITLEPGGQVEWSSRPQRSLSTLGRDLDAHLEVLDEIAAAQGIEWVEAAVDPVHPVTAMPWMPKARYNIMGPYLGARGGLAHRMMTQSASIQVAFDYSDPNDWKSKFAAAARLAPLATALFANSSQVDGMDSGYRSYRQKIWRDTDPDRCGLPRVVFDPAFDLEAWLDWVLEVPAIFRHKARGLVPAGGVRFREFLELSGCDAIRLEDWETHVSTIFTEVRSYTYIEVRSADLQPADTMFAVPAFWTGLLYHEASLDAAAELGAPWSNHEVWAEAMEVAARDGLDGAANGETWRAVAGRAVRLALEGLRAERDAFGGIEAAVQALERLAELRNVSF